MADRPLPPKADMAVVGEVRPLSKLIARCTHKPFGVTKTGGRLSITAAGTAADLSWQISPATIVGSAPSLLTPPA
jgi:hypothetical protein